MDDVEKRLSALTPQQRELLELRLRNRGVGSPLASETPQTTTPANPLDEHRRAGEENADDWKRHPARATMDFGLYFFSGDGSKTTGEKYHFVVEGAKFADRRGFKAVWTPERHFQDFGGLYPNPSVLSAALAVVTERIEIRAGSVVLPLHHPVRVAEEWSVVDNLSGGRVAVSFASGWHPDDFIFAPESYRQRREVMFKNIEVLQRLWAGETVTMAGVNAGEVAVQILPKPVQPRLPVWVTSAGSAETWMRAGAIGANVLAAYVGYSHEELAARIALYRESRAEHGHGATRGIVSIMLHTFVGDDEAAVKETVRAPFSEYLRSYFKQYDNVHVEPESLTESDRNALMTAAFERYFAHSTLMGTPAKCARLVERLAEIGVDEVACLVDFGVATQDALESLKLLDELRAHYAKK